MKTDRLDINIDSGIIYRNPMPHVKSKHAYFPSVVVLPDGDLLASFVIGEAFEAMNLDTHVSRSSNEGKNWTDPHPILPQDEKILSSNCGRITSLSNGDIVAMVVRSIRHQYPEAGLANPENLGFVPTELLLTKSEDKGLSWSSSRKIAPPLEGPSFEACSSIIVLNDGRWIWPTSTWRSWDGYCPNGMKMIALVSYDQGQTWPDYMNIMDGDSEKIIFWEGKVHQLKNGNLISVAWAYDEGNGRDLANHYAIYESKTEKWSDPQSTNILGQTMSVSELKDGRILVVYRRMDKPGLWANICRINSGHWINEDEFCLWGNPNMNLNQKSDHIVQDFNELKFGAPCIVALDDRTFFIAFWCYEKLVSNIRWVKLKF